MGALVSKPVAARGFMSGRGPEAVPGTGEREGRSERSERRVWAPMLPAVNAANGAAARGAKNEWRLTGWFSGGYEGIWDYR